MQPLALARNKVTTSLEVGELRWEIARPLIIFSHVGFVIYFATPNILDYGHVAQYSLALFSWKKSRSYVLVHLLVQRILPSHESVHADVSVVNI
jgi:hypothetical protein